MNKMKCVFMLLAVLVFSLAVQADILREYWTGISGASISDLTHNSNYPDNPTNSDFMTSFEAPVDWANDYGTRMRGYLIPPVTGEYYFWIATDDGGELWLSSDEDPGNITLIAQITEWASSREWNKYASQKSAPITLTAGKKYYIEALQKEAQGGDNLAVGWAKPGQATTTPSEIIPGSALLPWTGGDPDYNFKPVISISDGYFFAEAPITIQLSASIWDDGKPLPANPANPSPDDPMKLRWHWSVDSLPAASLGVAWSGNPNSGEAFTYEGSSNPPTTQFHCNPTATFDRPGQYVLNFTASDGEKETVKQTTVFIKSDGSYRQLGYSYLSPMPGSEYTAPQTQYFLVRFDMALPQNLTNLPTFITVQGNITGQKTGTTKIASDGKTVIFKSASTFQSYELVTVTLNPSFTTQSGDSVQSFQYQFRISGPMTTLSSAPAVNSTTESIPTLPLADNVQADDQLPAASGPRIMPNGVSVPSNFPHIDITINNNPDSGYIFLDNRTSGSNSYNVIFDNSGSPIWYLQTDDERRDMKVQQNGILTMLARDGGNRFVGLNTNYQEVASYAATNGYSTDEHEMVVLENGHYLLIGLHSENVDMTQYVTGANTNASVGETVIQEFTPDGDLIFQWRAWDHFDVRDLHLDNNKSSSFRFPHMNAIDIDTDGNILLSSRHISEITKIDRETGEIIWRLGGAHSDFNFIDDPLQGPRNQHAIRHTGLNRYLLFDNGDLHSPQLSRACEYEVDLENKTASLIFEYRESPDVYAHYMGNTQRLPNGNTLINWAVGNLPKLTEVQPDGVKAFEMNWADGSEAYRVWRCPWLGMALKPNLIIEPQTDNITLLFNKFGDPDVAYYRIYAGLAPQPTTVLTTSTTTLKKVTNLQNNQRYYFRVTAVNKDGVESDFSEEKNIFVNIEVIGQNIVRNGTFSQDDDAWIFEVSGSAAASLQLENDNAHMYITSPGTQYYNVQLRQAGLSLIKDQEYIFQFDAWSDYVRTIEAKVGQDQSPFTNYSKTTYISITPVRRTFKYPFTMTETSDGNARVVFNCGTSSYDVYIDNVIVLGFSPADFNQDGIVGIDDLVDFLSDWLDPPAGANSDLNGDGLVDLNDLALLSKFWTGENL